MSTMHILVWITLNYMLHKVSSHIVCVYRLHSLFRHCVLHDSTSQNFRTNKEMLTSYLILAAAQAVVVVSGD